MNIFTPTRWLTPALAGLFIILSAFGRVQAQCVLDAEPAYLPIPTFNLAVDFVNPGNVNVNGNVMSTFFVSDCSIETNTRFYDAPIGGTFLGTSIAMNCSNVGQTFTFWISVWDGVNLAASESPRREVRVTIVDQNNPTITCPANLAVNTDPNLCFATVPGITPVTDDNCSINRLTWVKTGATSDASPATGINTATGTAFNVGVTTVTYTTSDPSNQTASCAFTVSVSDNEPPVIICPTPAVSYNTDPGQCYATVSGLAPTSADNCSVASVTWTAPGATPASGTNDASSARFPKGTTTLTYTVSDNAAPALTNSCQVTITVADNQAPSLSGLPANLSISTSLGSSLNLCDSEHTWNHPAVTDNCAGPYTLTMELTGFTNVGATPVTPGDPITQIFLGPGTTTVTYVATDADGLVFTNSFDVTVVDDVPPVITPSYDLVYNVNVTPGDCSAAVTYERPNQAIVIFLPPFIFSNYTQDDCGGVSGPVEETPIVNGVPDPSFLNGTPPLDILDPANRYVTLQFPVGTTVLPFTWTDNAGNSTTVNITVNVLENVLPNAVCNPGIITLPLDAAGLATLTAAMVNSNSTDNCGIAGMTVQPSAFNCTHLPLNQTVTLRVTDLAGNVSTCSAVVDVVDNLPPVIQCPTALSANADNSCTLALPTLGMVLESIPANLGPGEFYDNTYNCGSFTREYAINGGAFSNISGLSAYAFPIGSTAVTIRVRDAANNPATCSFNVNVSDKTGPAFVNPPADVTLTANIAGCLVAHNWVNPTINDACSNPSMILSQTHFPGAFFPFGVNTITYLAKDNAGNISTYAFRVTVVDNQAPVANCKNITVYLDGAGAATVAPVQVDNNSSDNCFYAYQSVNATYGCNNLGNQVYQLVLVDGSGNTAACNAVVTVLDTIRPTAVCANLSLIDLDSTGNFQLTAAALNNGSTDNCPSSLVYEIAANSGAFAAAAQFTCAQLGTNVVTLRVTDGGNNSATCSRTITVRDVTAPIFTAPANVTVSCEQSTQPTATGAPTNLADACDAQPEATFTDNVIPGACANERVISRRWSVTDDSGNSRLATQVIVVRDLTPPSITLPDTITLQTNLATQCSAPQVLELNSSNVSDNCTPYSGMAASATYAIDYPTPGYGFTDVPQTAGDSIPSGLWPVGTTKVTWRISDPCGNISTKVVTVIVQDNKGPVFDNVAVCGQSYVLTNTPGACSNLFSWVRPAAVLNSVFDCLPFTVNETVSDATVQQAINLTNLYNYTSNQAFHLFVSAQFPVGTTTINYLAQDAAGNTSVCSFTVEVLDSQVPALSCPQNQVLAATCPNAQIPDYRNLVLVSDNCPSDVMLTQVWAPGTTLGSIFAPNQPVANNTFTVTITGKDKYNTSNCSFNVTLKDGDAPIPTVAVLPNLIDSCGVFTIDAPTALDPCNPGAPIIYGTPSTPVGMLLPGTPPRYNLLPGSYVITWVYNDGNGNVSTQPQNITILNDTFPPVAICKPAFTVNLSPQGAVGVGLGQINNGSFDPNNCGILSYNVSQALFDCSDLGVNVVTLFVTDLKGNTATCTTTITVKDVNPPVFLAAPASLTVESCGLIPPVTTPVIQDSCDATPTVVFTEASNRDSSGFGFYNYDITRTWVVTDDSGNTATHTQVINVRDTKAPVFSPNAPDTVIVSTNFADLSCADTVVLNMAPFISDCATGVNLTVTNSAFPSGGANATGVYPVGTTPVVFTATDVSGNVSQYTVIVIVRDGTPPTAVCINGVSAALQPSGAVVLTTAQFNNNSYDNCAGNLALRIQRLDLSPLQAPATSLIYTCADADGVTQHPVRLTVTDGQGNMSVCETFVVIQDNTKPVITSCPPNRTVQCSDDLTPAALGTPTATDNCAVAGVTYVDNITAGTGATCEIINRSWRVVDPVNNLTTCLQQIQVQDTIRPIFTQQPPDITLNCTDMIGAPIILTATDNCTQNVAMSFVQDTIQIAQDSLCGKYSYTIRRTWTAVDDCGNSAMYSRTITVRDTIDPVFLGLPDTITVESANFTPNNNCKVPVSIHIGQYLFDCAEDNELLVTNDAPLGDTSMLVAGNYTVGEYMIHFSAIDPCGNNSVDSFLLRVVDNSVPTAICNGSVIVSLGTNGLATIEPDDIDLGSSDNCSIDTMYLSIQQFDCSQLGANTVSLTVVDQAGNSNVCTATVQVTLGSNSGISVTTTTTGASAFGVADGSATAIVTGGSGNFSYEWSNGDVTKTITGLVAGIYIVTVTDNSSGCASTSVATVADGPQLTIAVGNAAGAQGQVVSVPITVKQFKDILAFSFSVEVDDPAVGSILGISNINSSLPGLLNNIAGGVQTVLWASPSSAAVTLPDDAVLFNLDILLGNAPVGSSTAMMITSTPVLLDVLQDQNGTTVAINVNTVDGLLEISDPAMNLELAGEIKTWLNPENPNSMEKPVENVTVTLSGGASNTAVTGVPGTYSFQAPMGVNTVTACSKSTSGNAGVTSGDLLRIVNHIFGDLMPAPYQWVAADVNNSKTITLADYLIIQRLVLGTDQNLMNSPDWKFIPKSYVFPSNSTQMFGPLTNPYPQTIDHNPVDMDFLDDDFVAVRMGDVNGNVPVNVTDDANDRYGDNETLYFQLEDRAFQQGEIIRVPFRAADFRARQAYQFTLAFDPAMLELDGILPGALPELGDENFGMTHLREGYLTTSWVSRLPVTIPDDEVLFTLQFRALRGSEALSNVLQAGSQITRAESYTREGATMKVDLRYKLPENGQEVATFALYQNMPNPFRSSTTISFRLPESGRATLRVFTASGQLVKLITGSFADGYNEITLRKDDLGAPGVYWYELETAKQSDRKKMILID
jgi:hypothetical protein